jgi:hypothetical protein
MSKSQLIKFSGWAFILGGLGLIIILAGSNSLTFVGSVISTLLLTAGMLGVRARYGEHAGSFGRSMLLLGMLGPVLWVIVIVSMIGTVTKTQVNEGLWVVIFLAPAISLLGLTLFGFAVLRSKPMLRLNWLPVLAGIWYPVTYVLFSIYDISHKGVFPDQYLPELVLMVVIQFLALCILGFVLIDGSSKELATV